MYQTPESSLSYDNHSASRRHDKPRKEVDKSLELVRSRGRQASNCALHPKGRVSSVLGTRQGYHLEYYPCCLHLFLLGELVGYMCKARKSSNLVFVAQRDLLSQRDCNAFCGAQNQYCCSSGSVCTTSNGIAGCTATQSSASSASNNACVPVVGSGQIACGPVCCPSWQYCAFEGQCKSPESTGSQTSITSPPSTGSPSSSTLGSSSTPGGTTYITTAIYTTNGNTVTSQYLVINGTITSALAAQSQSGTPTDGQGSNPSTDGQDSSSSGSSKAWIAGPVVGGIVGILLIVGVVWYLRRGKGIFRSQARWDKPELHAEDLPRTTGRAELQGNDEPMAKPRELETTEPRAELS
ncbi:hypothetical protein GQ53DRAFT_765122 [Thozetella sp. PMI_491]|nr:hypothetical protein GQ53DRAFT_765122 [Thozetella sp. PMI_491]